MGKTNKSKNFLLGRLVAIVGLSFLLAAAVVSSLAAQTVNQGYNSDEPLQKGMLVAAVGDDQSKVEKVTKETLDKLKGVVVQQNDSPVTLAITGQDIFVATSGIYPVLVSDENGEIKSGDYISISSLAGIGMKATDEQSVVIGRAAADFKGQEDRIGTSQDPATKQKVNFGRVNVSISATRNPLLKENNANRIPKLLEKVSVSIAGKPVNTARIWMATAVFLGTALIVGVMLYSGARGSLISVGRNPLSKSAIIRGLLQIVALSLIVFITGMFAVYLLLKL